MTHWDGLTSANTSGEPQRICILGATNRIQDIDEAILRRMPKKFPVGLPSAHQRRRILNLVLRDTRIDRKNFDEELLVKITSGMSGSDIKEACRDAAMVPVREFIKTKRDRGESMSGLDARDVRGIRTEDFLGRIGTITHDGNSHKRTHKVRRNATPDSETTTENEEDEAELEEMD
jgi:SpoVK/Ycf46/Vps4 family AAA+-type ATPase